VIQRYPTARWATKRRSPDSFQHWQVPILAMAGGTSPVTLAGTLVTHNAEVLGGITLNQLVQKGAPVIYGSSTTAMDLKIGAASVGTPECAIISGAVARLARYYALPCYVAGG